VLDYGFRVVIAPSFADIFYNNCFKNGVLPVQLGNGEVEELFRRTEQAEGYRLSVNLETQTVTDESDLELRFDIDPFRKHALIKGLDEIGLTLERENKIAAFEKAHPTAATMYEPVDVKISTPQP